MSSRHGVRLAALLTPLALLVPVSAHADTASFDDSAGDAQALNIGAAFGEIFHGTPMDGPFFLDAPAETSADIIRTTVDHTRKRLTFTVEFRDLIEVDGHSVDVRIFTPGGRYDLTAGRSGGATSAELFPVGRSSVSDGDGTVVSSSKPCRTVRARYDLGADTLTTSVPTACLGAPDWVRVAVAASRMKVTPQADGSANLAVWGDDAFRSRLSENSLGRSPKVRRG